MPTITHPKDFSAERAWGALDIATFDNTSVRLHWTDQPYIWHVNDAQEVFVVVDGVVDMFYREAGTEHCVRLHTGDISMLKSAASMWHILSARHAFWWWKPWAVCEALTLHIRVSLCS